MRASAQNVRRVARDSMPLRAQSRAKVYAQPTCRVPVPWRHRSPMFSIGAYAPGVGSVTAGLLGGAPSCWLFGLP